jgi:hypothetical protein
MRLRSKTYPSRSTLTIQARGMVMEIFTGNVVVAAGA